MDLEQFRQEVERRVAAADKEPKWTSEVAGRYMAGLEPRRRKFIEIARQCVASVIEPRIAVMAESFPNAQADRNTFQDRSIWWFEYCARFPLTARLEISVAHNEPIDQVQFRYELDLMPSFYAYDAHDKCVMPINTVEDNVVVDWVERKLLDFLNAYLTADRRPDDVNDEPVKDPVCGMRIRRSAAAASSDYKGHPYFFCSASCHSRFDAAPAQYVSVRMI